MKRLSGFCFAVAIAALLVGPWLVQAQNPAQRVIIMDSTGTHAASVSSGNALSTSASVTVDNIAHITTKTHVVGSVQITNEAGTVVTVTGTALDVNCTGCAAASVVAVSHISSVTHVAITSFSREAHLAVAQSGTWNIAAAHQGGNWTIAHVTSVAHMRGSVMLIGQAGTVATLTGTSLNVNVTNSTGSSVDQSGTWTIQAAHQGGNWNVAHIGGAVHVAAIAQPVHVVGVSIVNSTYPLPCHSSMAFHTSARATTIAHANSGMKIYICGILLLSQDNDRISIVEGQGASCATGRVQIIGHTTAALSLPATGGFSAIQPFPWIASQNVGNSVCLIKGNATAHVSGVITYRGAP